MKYRIVLITILASVGFFNPHAVFSEQLQKLMFYLCIIGGTVYAMMYGENLDNVNYPRKAFVVLLSGIVFSGVMATAFHMQSLTTSIMTLLPYIFAYFFFYTLMKLDVDRTLLMNTYICLSLISGLVYFANLATVPNNIFGEPLISEDTTRGIIRLPVVFIEFFPMIVFYAINRWLDTHKFKWIWLIAFGMLMIFLSVIRQIIALTAVLGLFFFFKKLSWKFKALMAVGAIGVIVFVLPMIPMYKTMIELSEQQREENDDQENIRITAWRYYTYENQTNALTPIFGNGLPSFGNSRWGEMFDSETQENGCFAVDVGWAGFFWHFGIITTIALLTLVLRALFKPKSSHLEYLNYWLVFLLITSCASGPPLLYWQIIDIVMCLYFVYKKPEEETVITPEDGKDSLNNTQLQQLPRYPQLH